MRNFFDLARKMKPMAVLSVLLLGSGLQAQATKSECVILLHGLARTSASMNSMQEQLQSSGYQVVNHDYPSRKETVQVLAESAIPEALAACADAK